MNALNQADGTPKAQPLLYVDNQIRYHLGVDPEQLSDSEWAISYAQLAEMRKQERDG